MGVHTQTANGVWKWGKFFLGLRYGLVLHENVILLVVRKADSGFTEYYSSCNCKWA